MATYNAPKPQVTGWQWFKWLAIRFVFPPVFLWDLIKSGANRGLGQAIGRIVLPAQNADDFNYDEDDYAISDSDINRYYNDNTLTFAKHQINIHDGAVLDTFEGKHSSQTTTALAHQKYILYFVGNGMRYEEITHEMKEDARNIQANVVGFNYRNVGQSRGIVRSRDDLVTDGIAQVQRLLDAGVSPQNITLKGHSLGGGIATLVAQHFHQLEKPLNLFNGRSFSSLTNFVVGHIRLERNEDGDAIGHRESTGGKILGWLLKPFIKFGVSVTKWEINADTAFQSIPQAYREHLVVRSIKTDRGNRLDDPVITHYASIHSALKSERREMKASIDAQITTLENLDLGGNQMAIGQRNAEIERIRATKNAGKMATTHTDEDGHSADLTSLSNRSGQTGQQFFTSFVQRAASDHGIKDSETSVNQFYG